MHDVPFDTTIDSLEGYLHRRRRSALPLTAGEAATIAIGVVRGCAEASSRATPGRWRLTADGRPVFVADPAADDVLTATTRILDEIVSLVDADVRPGFARIRDGVLTEPPRAWETLERRLSAVVAPRPVVLGPLAPAEPEHPVPPSREAKEHTDDILPRLFDIMRGVGRHRRAVTVAGVIAALLVFAGLSMPADPSDATAAGTPAVPVAPSDTALLGVGPTPSGSGGASAAPDPSSSASGTFADASGPDDRGRDATGTAAAGDLRATAATILTELARCADDTCVSALREGAAAAGEPAPLDATIADVEVVDDFGGLAVVRVTAGDRTQYATLVREKDRWLVRSVRDVADQPS